MVEWGWYAEAYKAIHDKIAELLAKLDAPSDPQTAQLLDNLGNVLFDNPAKYLPVRLTDGTSFYAAGGGAGGGLVHCQIRNEADNAWINEPFIRKIISDQLPSALTALGNLKVSVEEGGAGGGVAQTQVRDSANVWKDVGYYTGNETIPVKTKSGESVTVVATDLDIRNLAKSSDEIYAVIKTDAGVAYDARDRSWTITENLNRAWNLGASDVPDLSDRAARLLGVVYGNLDKLQQRATTKELLAWINNFPSDFPDADVLAKLDNPSDPALFDIIDRATRDLGKLDIAGFDVPLPAGTNKIGKVDAEQSDPANLKATVTQAAKDRTITDISKTATQKKIDLTTTGVIHTPTSGKKIRIKGFTWSSNADVVTALRFGTSGDLLFAIQAKGVIGMNLIGANIEGGVDEALYGYLSGTGTMKGTVLIEEV